MMERHNRERAIVFRNVQLYRHDRLEFLYARAGFRTARLVPPWAVKQVRGAYMEKEREQALPGDSLTESIWTKGRGGSRPSTKPIRFCIAKPGPLASWPARTTSTAFRCSRGCMDERGHRAQRWPDLGSGQLLGMCDQIKLQIRRRGVYNVAKYGSYGRSASCSLLIRRAGRIPALRDKGAGSLSLITTEERGDGRIKDRAQRGPQSSERKLGRLLSRS
jgi:proline dehydrogenase